ncbi:MerR family transcriptional regulator [Alkalihalobacillus pseudalcaliphilus]|uniref:MerR family transcriptional regulator n=1 Tax=Alkalihalobacillus pseudalcaliphilus TaxID=79884 RepID=UPI00069F7F94|nr:MerR family transcriptional regulator [Alkalihalobacillus pseudalcaliphilus]
MSTKEAKYNIKAVAKIVGIQPGTLRAWERRYQFIEPLRNQAGHRVYTDEQIRTIQWLIEKMQHGLTIGQAVEWLTNEGRISEVRSGQLSNPNEKLVNDCLNALLIFDEREAEQKLEMAFSLFSIEHVIQDLVLTVYHRVHQMKNNDEVGNAQFHFVETFLTMKMSQIYDRSPKEGPHPKILAVSAEKNPNELALVCFILFLRRKGFKVINLGASMSEKDLIHVTDQVQPAFIVTSEADYIYIVEHNNVEDKPIGSYHDTFFTGKELKWKSKQLDTSQISWENWAKDIISNI